MDVAELDLEISASNKSVSERLSVTQLLGHGQSTKRRCSLRLYCKTCLPESKIIRLSMKKKVVDIIPDSMSVSEFREDAEFVELSKTEKDKDVATSSIKEEGDSCFVNISSIDSSERESICFALLVSIFHHSSPTNNMYVSYIQKILKVTDDHLQSLYEQAEKKENAELHLLCCVKSASHLQPKDLKSLPDIVCHLTILSQEKNMESSLYSQNIVEWKEKGLVPKFWTTKFALATLSPSWNETFALHLNDPAKEMVVIEIWGRKNKTTSANKKPPKMYFKKEDSFIGRAFYLLKTTPIEGEERVFSLYSHSGKHERGKVTLQLSIKGQREDIPDGVSIREYILLLKLIVDHESRKNGSYLRAWDTVLSTEAETILLKHVEFSEISILQEKAVRLHVFLEYQEFRGVKLAAIADLMEEIVQQKLTLERGAVQEPLWVKQLIYEMKMLRSMLLKVVSGHLVNYNIKAISDIKEIEACLRILVSMNSYNPLLQVLKKEESNLKSMLEISIQVAVPTWFLELSRKLLSNTGTTIGYTHSEGELELIGMKGLCIHCLKHAQRAYKTLNPIFNRAGVDYFSTFYVTLDKLLCGEAMPRIKHFNNRANDQIVYELYVAFKDLAKLSENISLSFHKNLEILAFHTFFSGLPVAWIDLATHKCKQNIEKAISFDENVNANSDQPRFSSSALDTEGFLLQLGLFWKNLEWPIATDAFSYLCTIIEQISQLALFYVDALNQSLLLNSSMMYDESGRFQSSERLCMILNNMYHVKWTLSEMPGALELESYYSWLEAKKPMLGDKAKTLVNSLLSSHDEDIENKISYYVDRITEKDANGGGTTSIMNDISSYFERIVPCPIVSNSLSITKFHGARHISSILKTRAPTLVNEEEILSFTAADKLHAPDEKYDEK